MPQVLKSALEQAYALDEADSGPGYSCYGGPRVDKSYDCSMGFLAVTSGFTQLAQAFEWKKVKN